MSNYYYFQLMHRIQFFSLLIHGSAGEVVVFQLKAVQGFNPQHFHMISVFHNLVQTGSSEQTRATAKSFKRFIIGREFCELNGEWSE